MKPYLLLLWTGLTLLSTHLSAQQASFTVSESEGCSPLVVSYDAANSSGIPPLTYVWDFGNGNTSSGPNQQAPGAIYTNPGTYTVTLRVTDGNGNTSDPVSQQIRVFANPVANFMISDSLGCPPLQVNFTDQSQAADAAITNWTWDFGDGQSSTDANASHAYASGRYAVSLIVRDANGCQSNIVKPDLIEAFPGVEPAIQALDSRTSCVAPHTVRFESQTIGNSNGPFQYSWDMGDGTQYQMPNPTHVYTAQGKYDVKLDIVDQSTGCPFQVEETEYIQIVDPNPDFEIVVISGCAPAIIEFVGRGLDGATEITWDFGDGTILSGAANDSLLFKPRHTYDSAGNFVPKLTVSYGGTACIREFTAPGPLDIKTGANLQIIANDTASCQVPFTTQFQSNITDVASWEWDFGDGSTSTEANPTHTYTQQDNFTVSLKAITNDGCELSATEADLIRLGELRADFRHNLQDFVFYPPMWDGRDDAPILGGCLPLDITFEDASTSPTPIVSWEWSFGDGNTLNGANGNPTHTYLTEGEFNVSMTVTTSDGCVATVTCDTCIRAGNKPEALLDTTAYPLLQCCSASTYFVNLTDPDSHDYVWYEVTTDDWHGVMVNDTSNGDWDFGSTVPVFVDSGQYVSTDFYAYNKGCVDKFELPDWTMLQPPYGSGGIDTFRCQSNWAPGVAFQFDTSNTLFLLDTTYIDSVLWEFGDPAGTTSNEFYPSITYPDTGTYWISVTTWNFENGCSCTVSGEQYLQLKVQADTSFTFTPEAGCSPLFVSFDGPDENVNFWDWYISSGHQSNDPNPVFLLDSLGTYDITLIVEGTPGCRDTVYRPDAIEVSGTQARLSIDRSQGCLPFSFTLTDQSQSTANIVSRRWIMPDGSQVENNDPGFSYTLSELNGLSDTTEMRVPVIMEVSDDIGCTDRDTVWLRISEPKPLWDLEIKSVCEGDSIFLTALAGDSVGVAPLNYEWDVFGLPGNQRNNFQISSFLPGDNSYIISLQVGDSLGCTHTIFDTLDVVLQIPQASFTANPTEAVCPPLLVQFQDSSIAGKARLTEWRWEFSDGVVSTLQNPSRIFSRPDIYDVSLIVTDSLGCVDTFFVPDLINLTGVQGVFELDTDRICVGDSITFVANSPNAATYTWDFGDGGIGLGQTVTHVYSEANLNFPALVLKDSSDLCSITLVDTLEVLPRPEFELPADTSFCQGGEALLNASVDGAIYEWTTGENGPQITANQSGIYGVRVIYPETGCDNYDETGITVFPLPDLRLDGPERICEGDSALIVALSEDSIVSYSWSPDLAQDSFPERWLYTGVENIDYTLAVADTNGCEQQISDLIEVIPKPLVDISHDSVCEGDILLLDASASNVDNSQVSFEWLDESGDVIGRNAEIELTQTGLYRVSYTYESCVNEDTADVSFNPLPESDVYEELLYCVYLGEGITLDGGDQEGYYWEHDGSDTRQVIVFDSSMYYFEAINEFGCRIRDSIAVVDNCPPLLHIPNVFTPNGDGENERFVYKGVYFTDFSVIIYSRWGKLIYQTTDPEAFWDGTYEGKDVPEGVYVYVILYRGTHPDYRKPIRKSGTVTVIR